MTPNVASLFLLVAAVLSILIGPFLCREHYEVLRRARAAGPRVWARAFFLGLLWSELGTAVVTYAYPVSGTVAPTTAQMSGAELLTCTVNFADADTTATITHNFQTSAAALLRLEPLVSIYQNSGGTPSPLLAVALATNTIVLSKQSTTAGTGGTVTVLVQRPHSIIAPNF